jgi:hypothetical protein
MSTIKLLLAPIRRVVHFPLFQLLVTVAIIVWLQAADSNSLRAQIYDGLDRLVDYTVQRCVAMFQIRSFTRSWLTTSFWIGYVYLACLAMLHLADAAIRAAVEFAARHNLFYLRTAIARDRGIAAYRAWLPLERIRPAHIAQQTWEETFAWPADNSPPYPSLAHRMIRAVVCYTLVLLVIAALLQAFTPFHALTWLGNAAGLLGIGG